MRAKLSVCLAAALCLPLAACDSSPPPSPSPPPGVVSPDVDMPSPPDDIVPPETPTGPVVLDTPAPGQPVVTETHWEETARMGNNLVVADVRCALPALPDDAPAAIRAYYDDKSRAFRQTGEELQRDARAHYEASRSGEFDFVPYTLEQNFMVSYNQNGLLSVVRDISVFSGGAHGDILVETETFRLTDGRLLSLDDLFSVGRDEYRPRLMEAVCALIEKNPEDYYENYREVVEEYFPEETFALTEDGLALYYGTYTLAPFAGGIPRFEIPYGQLADIWKAF
ncbi:MAG: DUF3298 and DUF4163 domain-containing protein [Oscillospiraceae bacterium]|jgi:hypothetical protein|nr:DUF3298 and DUF4163 domain-containing protein [Oscillospiraceae bacterium]